MKKLNCKKYKILLPAFFMLLLQPKSWAQDDTTAGTPVVKLHYYSNNNSLQYLMLESMVKKGKVLTPQQNKSYDLFLDSSATGNLVAHLQTDETGKAKAFLPPALKAAWDASPKHLFIVKAGEEEVISDYSVTKSKITLDTSSSDGVKTITVSVSRQENNAWVPAKDVEMRVGYKRLGGILSAGDDETYTTDSSGSVAVEVKKDSLPGDEKGNIILAARVEDNDEFGNLQAEKTVSWGVPQKIDTTFFEKRTLWTTSNRTPYWLLLIAYSIVLGVWGTLIYLVIQLVKIKRLGKSAPAE